MESLELQTVGGGEELGGESKVETTASLSEPDDEDWADARQQRSGGRSTLCDASFNFVNSIVGAGVIGIP